MREDGTLWHFFDDIIITGNHSALPDAEVGQWRGKKTRHCAFYRWFRYLRAGGPKRGANEREIYGILLVKKSFRDFAVAAESAHNAHARGKSEMGCIQIFAGGCG